MPKNYLAIEFLYLSLAKQISAIKNIFNIVVIIYLKLLYMHHPPKGPQIAKDLATVALGSYEKF